MARIISQLEQKKSKTKNKNTKTHFTQTYFICMKPNSTKIVSINLLNLNKCNAMCSWLEPPIMFKSEKYSLHKAVRPLLWFSSSHPQYQTKSHTVFLLLFFFPICHQTNKHTKQIKGVTDLVTQQAVLTCSYSFSRHHGRTRSVQTSCKGCVGWYL